jgi:multiple sugar transport system permease protein
MLQHESGPINQYLALIGLDGPNWLRDPYWAMVSVIVTRVFKNMGLNMILFMATIISLPKSYNEAAMVDGANRWQRLRYITLPQLAPTTLMVVVITVIGSLKVFDHIVLLTGGGPANATMVLVNYIYHHGFQTFETGYASSLAVVLFFLALGLTILQWSTRRRFVYYEQ